MKFTFWKAMSLLGFLGEELVKIAENQKVTVDEALRIVEELCKKVDLEYDKEEFEMAKKKLKEK